MSKIFILFKGLSYSKDYIKDILENLVETTFLEVSEITVSYVNKPVYIVSRAVALPNFVFSFQNNRRDPRDIEVLPV